MRYKVQTLHGGYTINARSFVVKNEMVIFMGGSHLLEVAGFQVNSVISIMSDEA